MSKCMRTALVGTLFREGTQPQCADRTSVRSTSSDANRSGLFSKRTADIASDKLLAAVPSRKMHDPRGTGLVEVSKISVLSSTLLES
jgi:hypothetical protein